MIASFLFGNIDEEGKLESTYLNEEVREALGNVADLDTFSREIVRDASEAGPSGSSLFSDTTPVRPLESAQDFTEIDELAEDDDNFKAPAQPPLKKPDAAAETSSVTKDSELILRSTTLSNIQKAKLLFPGFAPEKKLRFSQMFTSSFSGRDLDRDWKYGKRKKKYKKIVRENGLWTKSSLPTLPEPPPDMIAPGDYEKIMSVEKKHTAEDKKAVVENRTSDKDSEWRGGPGSLWYDLANVPKNATNFDYGFKLCTRVDALEETPNEKKSPEQEDLYLMYNHLQWEDLVAWDNSQIKSPPAKHMDLLYFSDKMSHYKGLQESILKPTNRKLLESSWENNIVWDTKNMKHMLKTPEVVVDPGTMLKIPIEKERMQENLKGAAAPKKEYPSKMRMKPLQTVHPLHGELLLDKKPKVTDPFFKLSCEDFYQPKPTSTENVLTKFKSMIQHSIPALELELSWFPTYMKPEELRRLHRPYLKPMRTGPHSDAVFKPVYSLEKYVRRKEYEREAERQKSGGGQVFFMRTREDISAKDGRLVLFENADEHPLLMGCIGMASRIKNYSKKNINGDPVGCDHLKYGDQVYCSSPYFLGKIQPGQVLQVLDNNMYQAPVYQHSVPYTDFILARTADSFYIRMTDDIFCVGQQFPKIVVPGPNSKRANQHTRNFLQVFIYRLFLESEDVPRRIKMDHIKAAFPAYSESSIRKRLKNCADFNRTGSDCGWWVLQDHFRLPSEEEIRKLVLPEDCCAFYSMQYAEQRLKDAGYGKSIKNLSDEEDEDDSEKILDDEVRIAPWTLTRTFANALRGKCQLEINGIADPTGCGEGYSYLRVPNKPSVKSNKDTPKEKPTKPNEPKSTRTVMGTDSDLRRLTLKNAREVLRGFGVPEETINSLTRWDVINLVRKLSTDAARTGEAAGMGKFARGAKYSLIEHQEKYKEECQRIFDLQTKVLSSTEVLSTDEEESSDEETNIDELGKDLESMLSKKKTLEQMNLEREEVERRDLQKLLTQDTPLTSTPPLVEKQEDIRTDETGRRLIIRRKFSTETGYYYREEVIARPEVIDAYLKIKETADKTNKRFLIDNLDEEQKDEVRKERRRIQEQLRRLNRAQERERMNEKKLKKAAKEKAPINMRCGACGETGHMKTNKHCKMYGKNGPVTEDQIIDDELSNVFNEQTSSLVKVEDTKIRIGRAFLAKVDEVSQKAAQKQAQQKRQLEQSMEDRAEAKALRKKKRIEKADRKLALKAAKSLKSPEDLDYLEPKVKGINRARIHPEVELRAFFEELLVKIREIPRTGAFHKPVSAREIPDYYTYVSIPMDLQTMRNHCINNFYQSREDFLEHLEQIVKNSTIYNGKQSEYTKAAESMLDVAMAEFSRNEEKLQSLEEKINPAANKSTQNQFNLILISSVDAMIKVPNSQAFHIPVNAKVAPDYYQVISTPMDLSTLRKNIEKNKYKSRVEFLKDVTLIFENSQQYNGADSLYTKKGEELLGKTQEVLVSSNDTLHQYEVLLSCEETGTSPKRAAPSLLPGGVSSPKPPFIGPPSKGSPESVYSGRVEDEESDQMSEPEQFSGAGQKRRYDSTCQEEEGQVGHTLFEDLMDSEDDSD